jgi:hypothetical protein
MIGGTQARRGLGSDIRPGNRLLASRHTAAFNGLGREYQMHHLP